MGNQVCGKKTIDELKKLLELRSQNGIELHVEQVRKKGLVLINGYSLSGLDTFKKEKPEELKNVIYTDLEYLVYRFQLTFDEITSILDLKIFRQEEQFILNHLEYMKLVILI